MAVDKKRKSVDAAAKVVKKAKTSPSAEKPAPVKSALKGSKAPKVETTTVAKTEKKKDNGAKEKTVVKAKKPANKKATAVAVKEVEEPASDNEVDDEEESNELTADQTAELLAGFSSSEDEEDEDEEERAAIPITEIPNAPIVKHVQKHIRKKTGVNEHDPDTRPGTVHLSRLPHGFFEPQMRAYLEQFGTITHLRLARNRKTGKSKHFAFIEFASSGVADIVAKTMDKYLLFGHIMQARRVPDEQITTAVDASDHLEAKVAAMRAHKTQIAVDGPFFALSNNIGQRAFGIEHYVLARGVRGPAGPQGWEEDLFAGLDA